jgi:hypothetical protein
MTIEPLKHRSSQDDAFWQRLVLPEGERRWLRDWEGSYRWFRSPNVVQLERYRGPSVLEVSVTTADHIQADPQAPVTLVEYGAMNAPAVVQPTLSLRRYGAISTSGFDLYSEIFP